jgi:SAM-dependent methyltransferase
MGHYNKCPLCDSEKIWLHIQTNDFFLSAEPFSLFRCHSCGFVFTQDHPDEASVSRYYASEEYLSHNDSAKGLSGTLYRFSRRLMLKKKRGILLKSTGLNTGNILDIGSGTGHFLSEMKRAGWNVLGIEINEKAREYAVAAMDVDTVVPDEISSFPDGSFDCITMWHVLEHFQDPYKYASETARLLKPGGTCIIALPNSNSFDADHYRKFWAAYDVPRHLWHFNPKTFSLFGGKTGFIIKSVKCLPLDVFYISMLSEKYKGNRLGFLTGIIKGVWFSFLSLFNRRKCSSLIYILKRNRD